MSTDFSIRPVGAPAPSPVVQRLSEAADKAVHTELPASQSVPVADASVSVRNDPGPANDSLSHQVVVDRDAAAIVYQVVDDRTNSVVEQFPEEAVLRRRAYFRTLDLTRSTPTRLLLTDRKA
jgi:hypothetical protein